MENKGAVGGGLDDSLFCYFIRIPPQFVLCAVFQFRSKIPCCTKTKTHSHSQAGSPRPVHVYFSLEISSLSHSTRAERPSWASSSASVGIDPSVNAHSPKESPRLSWAPHHIRVHSASRSLETFCFYIWVHAQAQFVCIVYKKTQQKTTGFIWDTGRTITHKKNKSSISLLCAWRLLFSEFVLPWHQLERAVMQNFQILLFMLKYANGKYFSNPDQRYADAMVVHHPISCLVKSSRYGTHTISRIQYEVYKRKLFIGCIGILLSWGMRNQVPMAWPLIRSECPRVRTLNLTRITPCSRRGNMRHGKNGR